MAAVPSTTMEPASLNVPTVIVAVPRVPNSASLVTETKPPFCKKWVLGAASSSNEPANRLALFETVSVRRKRSQRW